MTGRHHGFTLKECVKQNHDDWELIPPQNQAEYSQFYTADPWGEAWTWQ